MIISSKKVAEWNLDIFIQFDQLYIEGYENENCPLGTFNYIINGIFYPGKGVIYELAHIINDDQDNMREYVINGNMPDIGKTPFVKLLEKESFYYQDPLNTGILSLSMDGYCFYLGFDGDEERFFFAEDINDIQNVQEVRFPKGTIESLIMALPNAYKLKTQVETIGESNRIITGVDNFRTKIS